MGTLSMPIKKERESAQGKKVIFNNLLSNVLITGHTVAILLCVISTNAQKIAFVSKTKEHRAVDSYPVPKFNNNTQFYLQRTTDANTIVYDLNIEHGKLNETNPIIPYWIRYKENKKKQNLSYIQNKYAFGVKTTKINAEHYKILFAAYDKVPLHLKKQPNGTYQTRVVLDGSEMILERLYLHIEPGGSFWSPNITYIEFKGIDAVHGQTMVKRIIPK